MRHPLDLGLNRTRARRQARLRQLIGRLLLVCLGCGLVFLWLLHGTDRNRLERAAPRKPVAPLPSTTGEMERIRQSVAVEDQRRDIDRTVWASELLAEKHGDVLARLWDELRQLDDKLKVLGELNFAVLTAPSIAETAPADNGVVVTRFSGGGRQFSSQSWRAFLRSLANEGYQLAQSEWRHVQFEPPGRGPARSTIAVTLYAILPARDERVIVQADLNVVWRARPDSSAEPSPERIEVTSLEVRRQTGEPAFQTAVAEEFGSESTRGDLEPVIVYDLDADGRSEILLPRQNLRIFRDANGQFHSATLCEQPVTSIRAAIVADFNRDGSPDLLGADLDGLALFAGDGRGGFPDASRRIQFTATELSNPFVLTAGDADADGDLDVWLGQNKPPYTGGQMPAPYYDANDGFPSFLLLNDGQGGFQDVTAEAGLAQKRFRRTSSASFVDLDDDGDLDLVVVSDFAGVDLHYNNGQGRFTDGSARFKERYAFGQAHAFGDFNTDGELDFFVAGVSSDTARRLDALGLELDVSPEFKAMRSRMNLGNRMVFKQAGTWRQSALSGQVAATGWPFGVTSFDFDNDGDLDLYIANGHTSRLSAADVEAQFWRHDIYVANSTPNPVVDTYFQSVASQLEDAGRSRHGYQKNRLFSNQAGAAFMETGFLAGVALEADSRCVVSGDLDGDGKLDLVVTTRQTSPQPGQTLRVFMNQQPSAGNWIGFHLRDTAAGSPIIGAKIKVTTPAGQQIRQIVTGESYRSQHASTAHFGLGAAARAENVQIIWPNGATQRLELPPINRYHTLSPGPSVER